eukprot:SAG31_NODE_3666_length_4007_cov_11.238741_3_plen_247_part_00
MPQLEQPQQRQYEPKGAELRVPTPSAKRAKMMVMLAKRAGVEASEANMRLLTETSLGHMYTPQFIDEVKYLHTSIGEALEILQRIQQLRGVEEVRVATYRRQSPNVVASSFSAQPVVPRWYGYSKRSFGVQKCVCYRGTPGCQGDNPWDWSMADERDQARARRRRQQRGTPEHHRRRRKPHSSFCMSFELLRYVVVVMNGRTYSRRTPKASWCRHVRVESWCEGEPDGELVPPLHYLWTSSTGVGQ